MSIQSMADPRHRDFSDFKIIPDPIQGYVRLDLIQSHQELSSNV